MQNNSKLPYFILLLNLFIFFYALYNKIYFNVGDNIFFNLKTPVIKVIGEIKNMYKNFTFYFKDINVLKKEIEKLHEENNLLKVQLFVSSNNCKKDISVKFIPAKVIAKCVSDSISCVYINAGINQNVFEGMGVINKNGVVGLVVKSYIDYSKVLLLTDVQFHINVILKKTHIQGLLTGTGKNFCIVKYLPLTSNIKKNDIVVTSNFSEIFPQNIPVGKILEIKKNNLYKICIIKPLINKDSLNEVFVIK